MNKERPWCWMCASFDVTVRFLEYRRAFCARGCKEDHEHHEDIPVHELSCKSCGNQWEDGSGDFRVPS